MNTGYIERLLDQLPFVRWDRWFRASPQTAVFYGWIDREEDQYKDFVVLELNIRQDLVVRYDTSSEKYTEEIAEILGIKHSECRRINQEFDVDNAIKLEEVEG